MIGNKFISFHRATQEGYACLGFWLCKKIKKTAGLMILGWCTIKHQPAKVDYSYQIPHQPIASSIVTKPLSFHNIKIYQSNENQMFLEMERPC